MLDIILANGIVVDGTGGPSMQFDVGVAEGKIAEVGDLSDASAARTIDISGLVVSPGFIDLHTHSDGSLIINPPCRKRGPPGGDDRSCRQLRS